MALQLGLDIVPLIAAGGGVGGLAALLRNPTPFINAAVYAPLDISYLAGNLFLVSGALTH